MAINIYVCDRGFVLVGQPVPDRDSNPLWVTLERCAVVRQWGTTTGLGQLASEGPQSGTKLDSEPAFTRLNLDYCLRVIPCDEEAWKSWSNEKTSASGRTRKRSGALTTDNSDG